MDYNTQQAALKLPVYGRNVQQMVDHLLTIEDKAQRTKQAKLVIKVMASITAHPRELADYEQKLWDHLYIMSDFRLEVDSPFPPPSPEQVEAKPEPLSYPLPSDGLTHYGRNIPAGIKLLAEECPEQLLEPYALSLAQQMKSARMEDSQTQVSDEEIFSDLKRLSKGKIDISLPQGQHLANVSPTRQATGQSKSKRAYTKPGTSQRARKRRKKRK